MDFKFVDQLFSNREIIFKTLLPLFSNLLASSELRRCGHIHENQFLLICILIYKFIYIYTNPSGEKKREGERKVEPRNATGCFLHAQSLSIQATLTLVNRSMHPFNTCTYNTYNFGCFALTRQIRYPYGFSALALSPCSSYCILNMMPFPYISVSQNDVLYNICNCCTCLRPSSF